jgi:hypothetical protein
MEAKLPEQRSKGKGIRDRIDGGDRGNTRI